MGRGGEWLKWGVLTSQERYPNIVNYTRDSDAQRETHRRWSPLINSNTFLRSTTGSNFLKLINNSKAKDKGNHAASRVWISDEKLLVFASLISPSKSVCLRSYVKHSSQCFITISKTSKFVKNTPLRVVFSTLFSVFDMWWKPVSCLMYYLEDGSHKTNSSSSVVLRDGYTSDLRGSDAESPHFVAKSYTCLNFSKLVFCDFVFGCRVPCAMVLLRAFFAARCRGHNIRSFNWLPEETLNSY